MMIFWSRILPGRLWIAIIFMIMAFQPVRSQKVGDVKLYDPLAEDSVMLSDYGSTFLVVIFWCNSCAYSDYYLDRIKSLKRKFSDVRFILVNPSPDGLNQKESAANMVAYYKDSKVGIPYLADKNQYAMNALGATKCPEAFVLEKTGTSFNISYHGAIDDSPQVASGAREHILELAIQAALSGSVVEKKYQRPIGCMIRKSSNPK